MSSESIKHIKLIYNQSDWDEQEKYFVKIQLIIYSTVNSLKFSLITR